MDDRTAGFTLLEVLISLALLGLLISGMATGLHLGVSSWRHAQRVAAHSARLFAVRTAIARLFEQAHLDYQSSDRQDARLKFDGHSDGVELLSMLPEAVAHDIVGRQSLYLTYDPAHSAKALTLAWALDIPGPSGGNLPMTAEKIMDGVSKLSLRYWGLSTGDTQPKWHDTWPSQEHLPDVVHVELMLEQGDLLRTDARVKATAPVSCIYEAINATCNKP